jgi:hypothetical protein
VIRLVLAYAQLAAAVVEFLAICAAANLIVKQRRRPRRLLKRSSTERLNASR